jgi:hypothetical protein
MPNTPRGLPYPAATDPVAAGAANIEALARAVEGKGLPIGAAVGSTSVQSLPPQVWTNYAFNVSRFASPASMVPVMPGNNIYAPVSGLYFASAYFKSDGGISQMRFLHLPSYALLMTTPPSAEARLNGAFYLAAGEGLGLQTFNSAAATTYSLLVDGHVPHFSMFLVAIFP